MGLDIVVKDIQEGARAEVSRIKAEGDAKASEIINEAKEMPRRRCSETALPRRKRTSKICTSRLYPVQTWK